MLVDIQIADELPSSMVATLPSAELFTTWLSLAYQALPIENKKNFANKDKQGQAKSSNKEAELQPEVSIRIVAVDESRSVNLQFRGKDSPTNVLSFESDLPDFIPSAFLGDLLICAQIINNEADSQNKKPFEHWAHIAIHGMLHLVGYDHINETDAGKMEALEIAILGQLGIDDPYQIA